MMIRMAGGWVFLLVPAHPGTAHPGSPRQRPIKWSVVVVVVMVNVTWLFCPASEAAHSWSYDNYCMKVTLFNSIPGHDRWKDRWNYCIGIMLCTAVHTTAVLTCDSKDWKCHTHVHVCVSVSVTLLLPTTSTTTTTTTTTTTILQPITLTSSCVLSTADEDAAHSVTQMSLVVIATQHKNCSQ